MTEHVVIVGAGIVGVSAGLWLRRFSDAQVTLIDRLDPGEGTSHGNAGVLAACAVVPVTGPGLVAKAPKMLLDPEYPLFLRWGYLPKLLPWLLKYLGHANEAETRRIAKGLAPIVADSVDQHKALVAGTGLEAWVNESDYSYAYASRADFEAERFSWSLRRDAGFEPVFREGAEVQAFEPALGPGVGFLATLRDHGYIADPGGYVKAIAQAFEKAGGRILRAEIRDVDLSGGQVRAVLTDQGPIACDRMILATGVWSKPLMAKLGVNVALESERGYHIVFEEATGGPSHPIMVQAGKFAATPMTQGLRCGGVLEFGGLEAGPRRAPLDLLRRKAKAAFPGLRCKSEIEWMGHRPATSDSLPVIGQVGTTGVFAAFGHHHIGLTGGPKTGRLVASLVANRPPNTDPSAYAPKRFQ